VDRTAASSQAAWALLTEGVTSARLEAHRLRLLLTRALSLCEKSERRDHLYEVAGDVIQAVPTRLDNLERNLDRTSYALSVLGSDHLRDILPMTDRKVVDDATEHARPFGGNARPRTSAGRVADRHLTRVADIDPPLGWPGGPCQVVDRIRDNVRNPSVAENLIDEIEFGDDLSNPAAAQVYGDNMVERNLTTPLPFKLHERKLLIGPHAQYRMDLRGVTVPQVRAAIGAFAREWANEKSRQSPIARRWEEDLAHGKGVRYIDKRSGLTLAFDLVGSNGIKVITVFWDGGSNPRPPGDGGCDG
jgi:hypothetical protein